MLFNSIQFAIFFPIVGLIYYSIPNKIKWILLLLVSYYFYMSWEAKYIIILFLTTCNSFVLAQFIEKESCKKRKKYLLIIGCLISLSVLYIFKYFNFTSIFISNLFSFWSFPLNVVTLKLILPIGISFYTFQTLSYIIDVYYGKIETEKHFGYYALYVSFFPQLISGPIGRTGDLVNQFKTKKQFDYDIVVSGLKLMAIGYFKKLVIADNLSNYVNTVYNSVTDYKGLALGFATIFFTIQIYCDFSGYTDIAIGSARILGINLKQNFNSPYFSKSIKEFWSNWHISLSTWFRDYVYIPLGGNRVCKWKRYRNLLITFLLSGLWHGANWTFICWGGIHGILQCMETCTKDKFGKFVKFKGANVLKVLWTFVVINFAWIFFRANSISDAIWVIQNIFVGVEKPLQYIKLGYMNLQIYKTEFIFLLIPIIQLVIYDWFSMKVDIIKKSSEWNIAVRWVSYVGFLVMLILFAKKGSSSDFVYLQF